MGNSIVYPWGSAPAGYVVVRHSSLAEATSAEAKLWEAVNVNPFAQSSRDDSSWPIGMAGIRRRAKRHQGNPSRRGDSLPRERAVQYGSPLSRRPSSFAICLAP